MGNLEHSLDLFCEKFPQYALHVSQWEPKEVLEEDLTEWRRSLKLDGIEVLYLFGLGNGSAYFALQDWLKEYPERRLVFIEESSGVIAALLHQKPSLLFDPQIDLMWLHKNSCQELSLRYPTPNIEMISLPGYDTAKYRRLRLQLLRKTTLTQALFVDRLQGDLVFSHFVRNLPRLERAFYANGLKDAFCNVPAIVCGAGPSLKQDIELIQELENKALIIAGGSAIAALSAAGFSPHFGIAVDPNKEEHHRFCNSFAFECPLLFSMRLCPEVFQTCNGPFGYMRAAIGGVSELWCDEELGLVDPFLGADLPSEALSVTAMGIAFAQHLGCNPILLSGVDLAYTGGDRYAPGVSPEKVPLKDYQGSTDRILRKKDKRGRFVHTAVRWVMEAESFAQFAKKDPSRRWINVTQGGLRIRNWDEMSLPQATVECLTQEWDLRGKVWQQIALHPMPGFKKPLLPELHASLERVIGHLEILARKKEGSFALAEIELCEELAVSILFYDVEKVLRQMLFRKERREGENKEHAKWDLYLSMAKEYLRVL